MHAGSKEVGPCARRQSPDSPEACSPTDALPWASSARQRSPPQVRSSEVSMANSTDKVNAVITDHKQNVFGRMLMPGRHGSAS
jgi:hypothetical protein